MLRTALPLTRRAVLPPAGRSALAARQPALTRGYANIKLPDTTTNNTKSSIHDPRPPVLPGTRSSASDEPLPPGPVDPAAPKPVPAAPSDAVLSPEPRVSVPLTPPSPPPPSNTNASTASQPALPAPKRKPRRFRRFILGSLILTVLGFGGGVAYSLRSDNFHDFFTEYVPFGEEAVLYFEEREFRKRFPSALKLNRPRDNSTTINIPQKSGLTWKVAEEGQNGSDLATKGRHMSAVDAKVPEAASSRPAPTTAPNPPKPSAKKPASEEAPAEKAAKKVDAVKEKAKEPAPVESVANPTPAEPVAKPAPSPEPASKSPAKSARAPEVNEPSVFLPVSRIDPLSIKNAEEPLVQDLVKILNDIIAVVNADNSNGKFTSTIEKAKGELAGVGKKIIDLKATEHNAAKEEVKQSELQFDEAARELVRRLEDQMRTQESKWRDELESERKRIANDYEERVHTEIEKSNQVMQQKVQNRLLEQAVSLKKEFTASVKDRVETEREGRLARLSELSSSVEELEKLTGEWNSVIDANLKTQHLQVAVEAVKSNLERTDRPRPFIKELAALKEIAANDSVVNSAIASINPIAYQRGVPTSAQLIDRFRRVADEVRKASLLPEDAGIASHAASLLLSKVMFKKQGRAVGNDVESILTRTETLLEEGNLDDAAREMNTLQGWAKALSQDWLSEARRVLEVKQALEVISTEARLQSLKVD